MKNKKPNRKRHSEIAKIHKEITNKWNLVRTKYEYKMPHLESIEKRLRHLRQDFKSEQGALLYLDDPGGHLVAISFNQPMWASGSVRRQNETQRHYETNPDHVLDLIFNKKAKSDPEVRTSAAYTGGVVGFFSDIQGAQEVYSNPKKRISRCDFHIRPFEEIIEALGIGYRVDRGGTQKWVISVPSEIVADYRVIIYEHDLRESFFPEDYK